MKEDIFKQENRIFAIIRKPFIMKVLVTGANGLLGHHIVNELLKRGDVVNIIVRSTKNIHFDLSRVNTFTGNFNNRAHLTEAMHDCDAIIHVAAVTSTDLLHLEDYTTINTDACRMITELCDELNISRIVFVSTANTIGYGSISKPADESFEPARPFSESYYAKSKLAAEEIFINYAKDTTRHVIIVNPAFLIGSMDTKPSSGALMLLGYRKPIMFVPPGGKNFVFVGDVAVACCNALSMGKSGERYFAGAENLSFREFYKLQSRVGDYRQKLIPLPVLLMKVVAVFGDMLRLSGIRTSVCSMNINQLLVKEYYRNDKIKVALQMPQTAMEKAVSEALTWFRTHGYIR